MMTDYEFETERLFLLRSRVELAGQVADYYRRNREFFRETDPANGEVFFTEEGQRESLRWVEGRQAAGYERRFWLVRREEPGRIMGMVSLNNIVMGAFLSCFLSYKLDAGVLRRGYMREALEFVVGYAFGVLGLHRLEANIMPRNEASLRLVEGLGFRNEGVSPRYLRINGVWEDHVHMVLLNEVPEGQV